MLRLNERVKIFLIVLLTKKHLLRMLLIWISVLLTKGYRFDSCWVNIFGIFMILFGVNMTMGDFSGVSATKGHFLVIVSVLTRAFCGTLLDSL